MQSLRKGVGADKLSLSSPESSVATHLTYFRMKAVTVYTKSVLAVFKNTLIEICIIFHGCVHKRKVCKAFETSESPGCPTFPANIRSFYGSKATKVPREKKTIVYYGN